MRSLPASAADAARPHADSEAWRFFYYGGRFRDAVLPIRTSYWDRSQLWLTGNFEALARTPSCSKAQAGSPF